MTVDCSAYRCVKQSQEKLTNNNNNNDDNDDDDDDDGDRDGDDDDDNDYEQYDNVVKKIRNIIHIYTMYTG